MAPEDIRWFHDARGGQSSLACSVSIVDDAVALTTIDDNGERVTASVTLSAEDAEVLACHLQWWLARLRM